MSSRSELSYAILKLLYDTPGFLVKVLPVSSLIASLFALDKLRNRNELTAIFSAGYSRKKFILLLSMLGLFSGLVLFYINAYLVPYARFKAITRLNISGQSSVTTNVINSGRIWFKGINYFVSYSSFDSIKNKLNELELYYFDESFKITEEIKAKEAVYVEGTTWELKNATLITNLNNKTFPNTKTVHNKTWTIDESILDFKKINADISTLSIWKLYEYILVLNTNELNSNEYFVSFLDKFSSAVTCLILTLLSAVAVFNPNRRNSSFGLNVTFVLAFTFFYWFIYSYFITLGQTSRISPITATFGVPGIFAIYLIFFFIYHRKLR
jgi:lipopolysaccharide export system permease protein